MVILRRLFNRRHNEQVRSSSDRPFNLRQILSQLTLEERRFVHGLIEKNPFTDLYCRSLILYLLMLTIFLLWPFDFSLNNVRWIETSNGIEFVKRGQVLSSASTENLYSCLLKGAGFSLETWVAPQNIAQSGPARIVSYSLNPSLRNFTLGQSKNKLVMRLRTTETDLNGVHSHLEVDGVFDFLDRQHIIITYDFSEQYVYVNGEMRMREKSPGGRFTNWDPSYYFVLGNEATGDRPWLGKIFYVAIYDRALVEKEVRQNYLSGWSSKSNSGDGNRRVSDGLSALYLFEDRNGQKIADSSGTNTPLDLCIPMAIHNPEEPYFRLPNWSLCKEPDFCRDVILNIVAFIPLGFLFHAVLRSRYGSSLRFSALVFILGTLFTLGVESLQHFTLMRNSSLMDVFANMLGTALGIAADRSYEACLKSRCEFL